MPEGATVCHAAAYTPDMKKLSTMLATLVAVAGWVTACYWRERSDWASPADVAQMLADAYRDAVEEEGPSADCDAVHTYASIIVVRAVDPPVAAFPWYAVIAATDFDVDEETGLRIVHAQDGWYPSKEAAHMGIVEAAKPRPRVDDEPEF